MNRRRLLQALGGSLLASGCAGEATGAWGEDTGGWGGDTSPGGSGGSGGAGDDTGAATILADTGPALEDRVPGSLTSASGAELDVTLSVLSGALPGDMDGHSFFVYPIPRNDGSPVFIGDGVVARLDYDADSVKLTTRIAKTPCYFADLAGQGEDWGFSNEGMARMSMTLGARNLANTAFLPMGDRLLLTFDAGRPHELDPSTVEIATPVGWTSEWRWGLPDWISMFISWPFPPIMSTAHPAWDPESGHLFTVDYGISLMGETTFTRLIRWDGQGSLQGWELVDAAGSPVEITQSVHQIAATRDYVILADTAFLVEMDMLYDVPSEAQSPDTVFWIVRRADLVFGRPEVEARRVTIAREVVHFLADFDSDGGEIVLHVAHNCAADPSEFVEAGDALVGGGVARSDLEGLPAAPTDLGAAARYVIDGETGAIRSSDVIFDDALMWGGPALCTWAGAETRERYGSIWWASVGFSEELRLERVESLYRSYPYRTVALDDLPSEGRPASLIRLAADPLEVADAYSFPAGRICLSPQHVPRVGATDELDGYIVCVVISDDDETDDSSGDEIWIFDAADLAQGPLARLGHPDLDLPFTLHTAWMPSVAPRSASYAVDVREDLEPEVQSLDADLQWVFERDIYPHFE